ncbi:hypothetical protein [Capnocytophaga sp. G2]|uniref:hypothetical protein n=1 Tax=Capnocytophaga sp. G2 TaxID=3110695 RepID=UPI002B480B3E|nr:hypothetical protein [Capnocytophaga sp. G2]MEB3003954.1 hypothetical protein [Capnocytophaga sp. G2]
MESNQVLYMITIDDVQTQAQEILGRKLVEDELIVLKEKLESGLDFPLQLTYNEFFKELKDNE